MCKQEGGEKEGSRRNNREELKTENKKASTEDAASSAIKLKPLNQFALIWTGPSQSRKCQAASVPRENQALCLHAEQKPKI